MVEFNLGSGKMSKKNCPKCGRSNIEKRTRDIAVGSGRGEQGNKYPSEEKYIYYACLDCDHEFDESDFRE